MKRAACLLFCVVILCGCDQLRGPKGDDGARGLTGQKGDTGGGLVSVETYSGTPTSNPFVVNFTTPIDDNCVINYYMVSPTGVSYALPMTIDGVESHYIYGTSIQAALETIYTTTPNPTKALNSKLMNWQGTYYISVKRFSTPTAAAAARINSTYQNGPRLNDTFHRVTGL